MDEKNFSKLNRIETKYVVKRDKALKVKRIVEAHLPTSYFEDGINFVFIKSTYLDSSRLTFYRNHLDGQDHRLKLRIRQYAPNGKWDPNEVFLEIKEKNDGEVLKKRIQLDPKNHGNVQMGKRLEVTEDLKALNRELLTPQAFTAFVSKVNDMISTFRLKPVASVMYKRHAYQDEHVRVTIDFNIIYRSENNVNLLQAFNLIHNIDWETAKEYGKKYDPKENAVVEIKEKSEKDAKNLPEWVDDMIDDLDLKETKFSKYVWAMYRLLTKLLG